MADSNFKLVQGTLDKLRSIEGKGEAPIPRATVSLVKELMEAEQRVPALLKSKRTQHPDHGKLVGEEALLTKLHNQFQDYVKTIQPEQEVVNEQPLSEHDQLLAFQDQLNDMSEALKEILKGSPSSRIAKVIQAYTIPALESLATNNTQTGSIADLLQRITSNQFEDYMARDKQDEKLNEMSRSTFDDLYDWMDRAERLGYKVIKVLGRKFHALNHLGEIKGEYLDNINTGGMGTLVIEGTQVITPTEEIVEQVTESSTYSAAIGPNKDTIVEAKEEDGGFYLYVNDKQFSKQFNTVNEAKAFAQELHKNLCEGAE